MIKKDNLFYNKRKNEKEGALKINKIFCCTLLILCFCFAGCFGEHHKLKNVSDYKVGDVMGQWENENGFPMFYEDHEKKLTHRVYVKFLTLKILLRHNSNCVGKFSMSLENDSSKCDSYEMLYGNVFFRKMGNKVDGELKILWYGFAETGASSCDDVKDHRNIRQVICKQGCKKEGRGEIRFYGQVKDGKIVIKLMEIGSGFGLIKHPKHKHLYNFYLYKDEVISLKH